MQQLLARFPAAVPALLPEQAPQPPQQQQQPGLSAAAAGVDSSGSGESEPRAASSSTVALVFGREESGLLESELLLCSHACAIPTGKPRCCNWLLLLPAAQTCLHCRWAHAASQAGLQCYRFPPFTARPLLPAPQVAFSPA